MKLISKKGFYCPSDTVYFNEWTKLFIGSAKRFAPWAHIHVHIFDARPSDFEWCKKHNVSITSEETPKEYCENIDTKRGYWVTTRFIRLAELYANETSVIAIDSDSLFNKELSESQFDRDLKQSWVTVRGEDNASLGSAVGFGNDNVRQVYRDRLLEHKDHLKWFLDQQILDDMIQKKNINTMDLRYSDFNTQPDSFIWTGKGSRKFKRRFAALAEHYRNQGWLHN